jgi:hypothetical protein
MAYEYPYPYDQANWNAIDQKYWCKMCGTYRYPVAKVREPFRYVIEAGKTATWETEYNDYLASLNAPTEGSA